MGLQERHGWTDDGWIDRWTVRKQGKSEKLSNKEGVREEEAEQHTT